MLREETLTLATPVAAETLKAEPFLHLGRARVYNPLTDRTLREGEPGFGALLRVVAGQVAEELPGGDRQLLESGGWLVRGSVEQLSRRFYLKYVSLEAHTVCNQACYFCPVSVAPRDDYFMPTELYEEIVRQVAAYRETIEAVFMINYNEPTLDRRFVDQVRTLKEHGLPPAVNTNGSGLTPRRIDALVAMGGLCYLSVNLSTLDRERYAADRKGDHLELILRNLDYAKDLPVAEKMELAVLGTGDDVHRRDFESITERFEGSRFVIHYYEVMDRAGYLQIGNRVTDKSGRLAGCENVGSRPLQHLHVTPRGQCVLCCEDYDELMVVGNLAEQRLEEVLTSEAFARYRRQAYGLEESGPGFICRNCVFALKG